jgi:uncharacterized oligopeptide transporter (OPT) family protein
VVFGQALLFGLIHAAGMVEWQANIVGVCISAVPAYYMSRAWVWGKRGKSELKREVLPFWIFVLIGLVMTVILGAANAYLGLRAGITIAATYPAAVIGMAILRGMKGSVLEENIARTSGTIGEGIAAGAIFTIPAFVFVGAWKSFGVTDWGTYFQATALILVGSVIGVLFISLVRRGMVEDPELPFPESVAAAEIHKAGQRGAQAAKYLFTQGFDDASRHQPFVIPVAEITIGTVDVAVGCRLQNDEARLNHRG